MTLVKGVSESAEAQRQAVAQEVVFDVEPRLLQPAYGDIIPNACRADSASKPPGKRGRNFR